MAADHPSAPSDRPAAAIGLMRPKPSDADVRAKGSASAAAVDAIHHQEQAAEADLQAMSMAP